MERRDSIGMGIVKGLLTLQALCGLWMIVVGISEGVYWVSGFGFVIGVSAFFASLPILFPPANDRVVEEEKPSLGKAA